MSIYHIVMSDGSSLDQPASSASDAIQSALMKYAGLKVARVWRGDYKAKIEYDVPVHSALTVAQIDALKPAKKVIKPLRPSPDNVPAYWMTDWMNKPSTK